MLVLVIPRTLGRLSFFLAGGGKNLQHDIGRLDKVWRRLAHNKARRMNPEEAVVSAPWLRTRLESSAKGVRVLDVSFSKQKDFKQDYLKAHIPGALFFNFMQDVPTTPELPLNIPDVETFQRLARGVGINDDSHVIVYDNSGSNGFSFASRVWWQFRLFGLARVSVMQGSLKAWTDSGYPTASGEEQCEPGTFTASFKDHLIRPFEDMQTNLETKAWPVVDCRPSADYIGTKDDPVSGHYPGAISIPVPESVIDAEHNCFKGKEDLLKAFSSAGVDVNSTFTAMCRSGRGACSAALAAYVCGNPDIPIYVGSFTEWKSRCPEKIEKST